MSVYMEHVIINRMYEAFKLGTGFLNVDFDKLDEPTGMDMMKTIQQLRLDYITRGKVNTAIIPVAQPRAIELYGKMKEV